MGASIDDSLILSAYTAQQGGGGKMEAEAFVAVVAIRAANKGGLIARIRAARLVGAWYRKYANYGL